MSPQAQIYQSLQSPIDMTPPRIEAPPRRASRTCSGPIHIGEVLPEVVANILARVDRRRLRKWKRGPNA